MAYVKPELLVLTVVLYFIEIALKKSQGIEEKNIPIVLGIIGVLLAGIWVIASCPLTSLQEVAMAIFTSIVQGILVAGVSSYMYHLKKQSEKGES